MARSFTLGNAIVFLLVLSAGWTGAVAADLRFLTEDSPPFNMPLQDKIVGISTDKLNLIMQRTKLPYKIELMPWARAWQTTLDDPNSCVFSTTRTEQREKKFKWVGPLAFNTWVLYGLKERNLKLSKLEDARQLTIGTYNADVRDGYLRERGYKVEPAMRDTLNPLKLMEKRIDLWASGPFKVSTLLEANGLTGKIVPLLTFNRTELYLACNLGVADSVIEQLNNALTAINNDGSAAEIEARYLR